MSNTCWRCGVDFDGSKFFTDAPCGDCQPYVEGIWQWKALNWEQKCDIIAEYHKKGLSDPEIAEIVRISPRTVLRWRADMLLPPNSLGGAEKWRNPDEHRQKLSETAKKTEFWVSSPNNKPGSHSQWRSSGRDFN